MSKRSKIESVEEYLARGGSIKKIPTAAVEREPDVTRQTVVGGPVTIMTMEEADLFYGEVRKGSKPKKSKPSLKIDLDALPEALRSKFIPKLKEEMSGQGFQEDEE